MCLTLQRERVLVSRLFTINVKYSSLETRTRFVPLSVARTRELASREIAPWILLWVLAKIGTLSNDDDDGSENITKKMNLRPFKLYRVYLKPLNSSNLGDFSWS